MPPYKAKVTHYAFSTCNLSSSSRASFCCLLVLNGVVFFVAGDVSSELMTRSTMSGSDDGKLKVFVADPFDYHSIVDALKGCSGLFYAFEPPRNETNYDVGIIKE